ncbi:MAG: ATP-binding protein [Gemmatimonadota bacterium]|nr:ATP-binding protein [Bryobacterales bacterium]MDE2875001.1 ATP-binding protein [Gemmatimonadota bacterium]
MTPESQNIEWKRSWRDEHLKWICGFANAQGGVLEIGKDDRGEVVGVREVLRLLEEIPNKVQSLLGIVVDVNLKSDSGREYLEIVVEPHTNPISYKGQFHYRRQHEAVAQRCRAEPVPAPAIRTDVGRCAVARRSFE